MGRSTSGKDYNDIFDIKEQELGINIEDKFEEYKIQIDVENKYLKYKLKYLILKI